LNQSAKASVIGALSSSDQRSHPTSPAATVQEAAARAWNKRQQLRATESPRAWFLAIVTNGCRMRLRSSWWRHGRALGSDPAFDHIEGPRHEASVEWSADLERALRRLSWSQRAVLSLYYQVDMSQEEIARVLRVRVGTVKSRLSRATAALRNVVEEEEKR
jgi:RNA polymerase sigma-70 factor (ECF subfamily)